VVSFLAAVLLGLVCLVSAAPPASAAGPCGPPVTSVIACEHSLPGDSPNDWQVIDDGASAIQGFATSMSVNAGQTESFKIDTVATAYHIDTLRIGYYQGNGARKIVSIQPTAAPPVRFILTNCSAISVTLRRAGRRKMSCAIVAARSPTLL